MTGERHRKTFVLFGTYGEDNTGDNIILLAMITGLRRRWPGCRLVILTGDRRRTRVFLEREKILLDNTILVYSGRPVSLLVGINTRLFEPEHFSPLVVANFESALAFLLRRILHDGQANFRFFPFYKERDRSDEVALARLLKHLGDLTPPLEVCRFSSLRELTESVGRCDFFIGVRYHSVLLAAQTGVPVLGISYGRKTWRFMTESGLGDFVLPLEEVTARRLSEIWVRLLAGPDDLREKLAAINIRQKQLALRHFDLIARTLAD